MLKYIPDYIEKVVAEAVNTDEMPEKWDENALNEALKQKVYPDNFFILSPPKRFARSSSSEIKNIESPGSP